MCLLSNEAGMRAIFRRRRDIFKRGQHRQLLLLNRLHRFKRSTRLLFQILQRLIYRLRHTCNICLITRRIGTRQRLQQMEMSISSTSTRNRLPQLMSVISLLRTRLTRLTSGINGISSITRNGISNTLIRTTLQRRGFTRHLKANSSVRNITNYLYQRPTRHLNTRCLINNITLSMLRHAAMQQQRRRRIINTRCLHRIIMRMTYLLIILRGRGNNRDFRF